MQNSFTPSINIQRDTLKNLNYIPTSNAQSTFDQLVIYYQTGIRAFSIIGSYGTGKSAFLWALNQTLQSKKNYFRFSSQFKKGTTFEFINLTGSFKSLKDILAEKVNHTAKNSSTAVIKAIDNYYQLATTADKVLVIIVDEFGKHLEFAAKNKPEEELYFIQQLAEYVNDSNKQIMLITTLHQNFTTYSHNLNEQQRNEWRKVKGRLKELTFNEPVEQLLILAADYMRNTNLSTPSKNLNKLVKLLEKNKVLAIGHNIATEIVSDLSPLDLLSASVLALSLQKYGQNERSLFTFLNSNDKYSIRNYDHKDNPYYNLSCIYNYLINNYYSFLSTKYNPHYVQWTSIKSAIEKIDGNFDDPDLRKAAIKIVQTIGLLNIFASKGAKLDKDFLIAYATYSLGLTNATHVIEALEHLKIVRFRKHRNQYILFEGTDIDIEGELLNVTSKIQPISSNEIVIALEKHFTLPYLPAKAVHYKKGTPRFFKFELSDTPINRIPKGQVDGFINLVFSENMDKKQFMAKTKKCQEAILYALFKNTEEIASTLLEIRKIDYLIANNQEISTDTIAIKEFKNLQENETKKLNNLVLDQLFNQQSTIIWSYKGEEIFIGNQTQFNKKLSAICDDIYTATPIFKTELANRELISGAISSARKKYFTALTNNWKKPDLGFSVKLFPPEKTIYLSLLKNTGIHTQSATLNFELTKPEDESFNQLWTISELFLKSAQINRQNLSEFEKVLSNKPLKLKKVFIDFWLPTFLFIRRNDFALFRSGIYVPDLTDGEIDLMYKNIADYQIKAFNVSGIQLDIFNRYRDLLQLEQSDSPKQQTFIETIKPFLIFYHQLPKYTRQTTHGLSTHTIKFREAIKTATDPETTFFEDFPKALGIHDLTKLKNNEAALKVYVNHLQNAIRELRTAFDELLNRVEAFILKDLGYHNLSFKAYKAKITKRYKSIKRHLLLPHQKTFFARLQAPIDQRDAWLNTLGAALMRKSLEELQDQEEEMLFEKLSATFRELDNLCDIHEANIEHDKEEIIKIEITSLDKGTKPYQIRLSKEKSKAVDALQKKLETALAKDPSISQAVLIKLLKKFI